jgi:hypothetical protein
MELTDSLLNLAAERCRVMTGDKLNGIVHNLNNPVHALTMQTELLRNSLNKEGLDALRPNLLEKCTRMERVAQELKSQLETLSWRDAYVNPARQLINPAHFGSWLLQFWQGDLLFKHNVAATLSTDPPPPHIQTVPLALTWCLEEPLSALMSILGSSNAQATPDLTLKLSLEFGPLPDGGLAVRMATTSEAGLRGLGGEIRHVQELRELTSALGWDWSAHLDQGMLSVRVAVPGKMEQGG